MTGAKQKIELKNTIWKIANDVRGTVDGWDFKQYVLGALFYRFISENFSSYIEAGDENIKYKELQDDAITKEIKDDAIKTKGYFIYPSQLFTNVVKRAKTNKNLNTDLAKIFTDIENSANGYPSEDDIKGLFADFDTTSSRLGNTVAVKNTRLSLVLQRIAELDANFNDTKIDIFGDAYEFLISQYAANAGKSGGEFFTPQFVSELISKLAIHKQQIVNGIYDPACGSGSLLLQAKKHFDNNIIEDGFYGQEINHTTYNLARMNMFLHNINYDKFDIRLGNTLIEPSAKHNNKSFDVIVSNPPYSIKWVGKDDPTLINDDRFAPAGVLAPKSKADFAFVMHSLSLLSSKGRAAIVCFPGIFYRDGAEQKIRKYLIDNNYIETIITLAPNLFYGTSIAVNILVMAKNKIDTNIQFIDASGKDFYTKEANNNVMEGKHINKIIDIFSKKENIAHIAKSVTYEEIVANDYGLSLNNYVEARNNSEKLDINEINSELATSVEKIDKLRQDINDIFAEIKG